MWCIWCIFLQFFSHALPVYTFVQYVVFSFFISFMVSFAGQKLLSLIRSNLLIFAFISVALGNWPNKTLIYVRKCSLLGVLWCPILSLSHFEFIFVYRVKVCFNFTDLHAAVLLSQHHLLKGYYSPLSILASFVKD